MSAITVISDLEIDDPGCVHHIREHLASGCPLEPLVEAVAPMSAEERAPLVAAMVAKANHLIAARNEAANELLDTSNNSSDEPKRGRGRPKSPVREKLQEAAREAGVSERTIRRDAARLEAPAPVVPKPPKPVPVERKVAEFAEAVEALKEKADEVLKYALADGEDRTGTWRAHLRLLMGELKALPSKLRDCADSIKRSRAALARNDFEAGKAARKVKGDAEKQKAREEKWARKQDERRARAEMVAEHGPAAYMSPLPPPKTGLGGKSLRVQMVDQQGNEMPYQEALDTADAAGVQGGAPEPFEEIEEEAF